MNKVKIVGAAELIKLAQKYNADWSLKAFEQSDFDGGYIESLMSKLSASEELSNMFQVCMTEDNSAIIFIDKGFAIDIVKSNPKRYEALLNDFAFRYISPNGGDMSAGAEFRARLKDIKTKDIPPMSFSGEIKTFQGDAEVWVSGIVEKMNYETLRDVRDSDFMEYFFFTICEPILEVINNEFNIKIDKNLWTYVACIDYVLEVVGKTPECIENQLKAKRIVDNLILHKDQEVAKTFKVGDPVYFGRDLEFGFITNIGSIEGIEAYSVNNGYTYIKKDEIGRQTILRHWTPKEGELCLFYNKNKQNTISRFLKKHNNIFVDEFKCIWENCFPFTGVLPQTLK